MPAQGRLPSQGLSCGCSSVAEPWPSKPVAWVRSPSPAPFIFIYGLGEQMTEYKVNFECGNLILEGSLSLPEIPAPWAGALLCHPHSLYGGNMDNNVIQAVSRALVAQGLAALCFNFRGVGGSQGFFGEGIGEEEDAHAALSFLCGYEGIDAQRIGILGYSFGGMVALSAGVQSDRVQALVGISPVIPPGLLQNCFKPLLLTYGTKDDVIPPAKIIAETESLPASGIVEAIEGADHFLWGYEQMVAKKAASFLAQQLPQS